jgi:Rrf2 family protein
MLTAKGKYGLKAMLHLADAAPETLVLSEEIASQNTISKKFLDTILGELRNAGFIYAKKGRNGGYALARRPDEIAVGHVLRVLDGPLAPIACASRTAYHPCKDCTDVETCRVRLVMLEVRNAIATVLDNKSLTELQGMRTLLELDPARWAAAV